MQAPCPEKSNFTGGPENKLSNVSNPSGGSLVSTRKEASGILKPYFMIISK